MTQYIYRITSADGKSHKIFTEYHKALSNYLDRDENCNFVVVLPNCEEKELNDVDQRTSWMSMLERSHWVGGGKAIDTKVSTAVNPKHYKGYVDDMQWIEVMSKLPTFKDPANFTAALELQVRKYLDRNGKKDASVQELLKARWYLSYLIAYLHEGGPIKVDQVDEIISRI